jgi:hypothetical protein
MIFAVAKQIEFSVAKQIEPKSWAGKLENAQLVMVVVIMIVMAPLNAGHVMVLEKKGINHEYRNSCSI